MNSQILYRTYIPGTGAVEVRRARFHSEKVRLLVVNGAVQSATYVKSSLRNDLVFDYMKAFDWTLHLLPDAKSMLMIGGGAFSYPKHIAAHHPEIHLETVEKSSGLLDIAENWFYFHPTVIIEDGVRIADPSASAKTTVQIDDGLHFLKSSDQVFDIILNDAFSGRRASLSLAGDDGVRELKRHLAPGGICAVNLATALKGPFSLKGQAALRVLRRHFRHTLLMPVNEEKSGYEPQNCLLFASAVEFRYFTDA